MRIDDPDLSPELRVKATRMLEVMCELDGINFNALRDELDWSDVEVQQCLAYLNSHGCVSARPLPSLQMRYGVTQLGWDVSDLLAALEDRHRSTD